MNTYKIDVNLVDAVGSATGKTLQVSPRQIKVQPVNSSGKSEPACVTWTFLDLPDGMTPVITFDSQEVIVSGPKTTSGAAPTISFQLRFPQDVQGDLEYPARYQISVASDSAKKSESFPAPIQEPCLVVIRTPDPPGGGA